ncbi:S-adenosyl-L-methionine-dependent methyltransferase [Meira miltonrushii]|uniref:S-adenosyl-L-methionine-dependent methyltransferase n=1 Tax=Meira miltonrushii TaxID=1280837 RepID=A0A316VG74_9BASI|nr:S-adenosyl-L-methionine-dependent methyltransferase [Meira miltonrushii]PWN36582.1 S-adenosyl-L-methionine-dependent methyltransferase [Meira miltonrushii]
MSATAGSSSPPTKKQRNDSPTQTIQLENGNTTAPAGAPQGNGFNRILTPKEEAKRIKSKVRDRQKVLEKMGEEPIYFDIADLLGDEVVQTIIKEGPSKEFINKFRRGEEIECRIERLSAHGEGLAIAPSRDWVIAVPHCVPGELVVARITANERMYSRSELVTVKERAAESSHAIERDDKLVNCKYFGTCSGCQYQHIEYATQLDMKRNVVQRAFKNFSHLPEDLLPPAKSTLPSPLQFNYRTKLTPHFELPRELKRRRGARGRDETIEKPKEVPYVAIGFDKVGTKQVLDIEECPIATASINRALPAERQRVKDNIYTYKNGATILLRDSLKQFEDKDDASTEVITDHKATVKERVGVTKFLSPAGTFFQNNRSILPSLISYVQEQIQTYSTAQEGDRYLVDAYCGSGLFSLCLATLFKRVAGVEISADSIKFAKQNATINGIENVDFLAGDAQDIFKHITYPSDRTTMILDPPRRGCDEPFIKQLLTLAPQLIVYVSCNVHTQARDVGQMINGLPGAPKRNYEILSIRGADLFPQTYHVEGICVLRRKTGEDGA